MTRRLHPAVRGIALVQLLLMFVALLLLLGVAALIFREQAPTVIDPLLQRIVPAQQSVSENAEGERPAADLSRLADVVASISESKMQSLPASNALRPDPVVNQPKVKLSLQLDPSLPDLNDSDTLFRSALANLDPTQKLISMLIDEELIRKLVVSIDNMAQGRISSKHSVLLPMTDRFRASEKGDEIWLDGYNYSRYGLYVELLTSIDSRAWVELYKRYYPQLQQAYAELGYPRQAFHDRVILALDHLLESPVIARALPLAQPSVMYTFANPELEALSAVHKQMLRLGPVNARKLLDALTVLRGRLLQLQS